MNTWLGVLVLKTIQPTLAKKISSHCDPKFHSVIINNIGYQVDEVVPNCNVMSIYVDAVIDNKAMSFGY